MAPVTIQTQPYASNTKPTFNYDASASSLLRKLYTKAQKAGVPADIIDDVVHDTIANTWVDQISRGGGMTHRRFLKVVTPAAYRKLKEAIMEYGLAGATEVPEDSETETRPESTLDGLSAIWPNWKVALWRSPRIVDVFHEFTGLNISYEDLVEQGRSEVDVATTGNHESVLQHSKRQRALDYFRGSIVRAVNEIEDLNIGQLLWKYSISIEDIGYELASQRPNYAQQQVAEYVAAGTNDLTSEELLTNPLFHRAFHFVLYEMSGGHLHKYTDQPSSIPIRANGPRNHRNKGKRTNKALNYGALTAQLGGSPSKSQIEKLLTDPITREKVGASKIALLWDRLPGHDRRQYRRR